MKKLVVLLIMLLALSSCGSGGNNTPNRCQAKTQDGTQCKRTAERGSIYCWQHK